MSEEQKNKGLFQDLWERRFFQFTATYLGVSWALIQFMEWLVARYDFSSSLVDKLAIFLVVMLPAVLIFIYNHGRPGDDEWKTYEKIFIPLSLILALILALALNRDSNAKAETEAVSLVTEEGETITRMVPKTQYTKQFVIFPFEIENSDDDNKWLSMASGFVIDKDIEQDMRIFSVNPFSLTNDYNSYDLTYPEVASFSTSLKIAQDRYSDFFIRGKLNQSDSSVVLNPIIYDSNTGEEFYNKSFEAQDIFKAIDAFSNDFMDHLYLPESEGSIQVIDLPASELVSQDFEALKAFCEGLLIAKMNPNNPGLAIESFLNATDKDPNCAECYSELAQAIGQSGQDSLARVYLGTALEKADALPERQQLNMKFMNYMVNNQPDKAILLSETWMKLYPMDRNPYNNLSSYYRRILEWDKAKAIGEQAIEVGHKGSFLTRLARLYMETNELDKAEKLFREYTESYPHKSKESAALADLYRKKGELDKAEKHIETLLIYEPDDVDNMIKLADIQSRKGDFETAKQTLELALKESDQTNDSISVYGNFEDFYYKQGQVEKSFELLEKKNDLQRKLVPERNILAQIFFTGIRYIQTGKIDELQVKFDELLEAFGEGNRPVFSCVINYLMALWTEDLEGLKKYSSECEAILIQFNGKNITYMTAGNIARLSEDYGTAVEMYETYIDSTGAAQGIFGVYMGQMYRMNKDYKTADSFFSDILKEDPSNPQILLEYAKLKNDMKNKKEAKKVIEDIIAIFENADEDFIPYQDALSFREELNN